MPRSAATVTTTPFRKKTQERSSPAVDLFHPVSPFQARQPIEAVLDDCPPEVADCFGFGTELGLSERQVLWSARNELLCWWLAPPETYIERRAQFDDVRERLRRLAIVRAVHVSSYAEPIQAGFINKKTHDVTELVGERWRISFYPGIRT